MMVSPKVITITPNRKLISPKVTKITFGEIKNCDFTLPSSRHPSQMPMYRAFEAREGE
jgi:hypothetical protein